MAVHVMQKSSVNTLHSYNAVTGQKQYATYTIDTHLQPASGEVVGHAAVLGDAGADRHEGIVHVRAVLQDQPDQSLELWCGV